MVDLLGDGITLIDDKEQMTSVLSCKFSFSLGGSALHRDRDAFEEGEGVVFTSNLHTAVDEFGEQRGAASFDIEDMSPEDISKVSFGRSGGEPDLGVGEAFEEIDGESGG